MSGLEIRPANPDERDWAARLMAGSEPWIALRRGIDTCLEHCHDPEYRLYVADQSGTARGFLILHPRGVAGSPYIVSIAVEEPFRGRGIGRALMQFAEGLFAGRSRYIFLCVSSFNPRARILYERLGYTLVGELRSYIIDGASELLMHKRL